MQDAYIIKGGRILDPANDRDETNDLYIIDGLISTNRPSEQLNPITIDATGKIVCPGLIDLHVHFREPGNEDAETIETGAKAAAAGGFTTVVTMPNTTPAIDSPERIQAILTQAEHLGIVKILPAACITAGRQGVSAADLSAMKDSGAIAFTDDGSTVADDQLMQEAMATAAKIAMPIMDHALDPAIAGNGVLREYPAAINAGLPCIPAEAEIQAVERDIRLAEQTGCSVHIQHISTKETVNLIRSAIDRGIKISAEATPHHLALTVDDIQLDNTDFKMNPPLGTAEDRQAIIDGINDGTIQAFATDHAPHTKDKKNIGMLNAPFGIVGLETAVGVTYTTLVKNGAMTINTWLKRWTTGPANILGIEQPSLAPGKPANLTILDLESEWRVDPSKFQSKSHNTPFAGTFITGRAICTLYNDKMTQYP